MRANPWALVPPKHYEVLKLNILCANVEKRFFLGVFLQAISNGKCCNSSLETEKIFCFPACRGDERGEKIKFLRTNGVSETFPLKNELEKAKKDCFTRGWHSERLIL